MTELTTIEANVLNIILPYRFDKPIKFEKVQTPVEKLFIGDCEV